MERKATHEIAQSCGNLAKLTTGMFARNTELGALKEYKDLIARFPRLSYVYYALYDLVLLAEPMQDKDRQQVSSIETQIGKRSSTQGYGARYEEWDVDAWIQSMDDI